MAEAEYLLPDRQRKTEDVPLPSVNGEERVPSPLPPEKAQEPPPFTVDSHTNHNGYEPHSVKTPAALASNKNQPCKKKNKCLSDIFGHMIGGSKETSVITKVPTTTCALTGETEDSPYADLESVPMLHRPKRAAVSPATTVFPETLKQSAGVAFPPGRLTSSLPIGDPEQSLSGAAEIASCSSKKHLVTFPASSGLMSRALKAEEDTDLRESQTRLRVGADVRPGTLAAEADAVLSWEPAGAVPSFTTCSSPRRRARKPNKKQIRNGSLAPLNLTGPSAPHQPVDIKAENVPQSVSLSPSSPSLSPAGALPDSKELMFTSLAQQEGSSSGLTVFQPDANYKFSTFLMLLKDMHDTREKEGKPLTLPPSAVLIKEEPLVLPSAAGDLGPPSGLTQAIKVEAGPAEKDTLRNCPVKPKKRTKAIMSSESYHFQDFPTKSKSHSEKLGKQHAKWRLAAKGKPLIPGLSSDLANLAYGREYVTGHADLAGPLGASHTSANYLDKNCGASTVAPKKRWQMVEEEEGKSEVERRVSLEMNGSFGTASPDLTLEREKQGNSDSFLPETTDSTAGKTKSLTGDSQVIFLSVED